MKIIDLSLKTLFLDVQSMAYAQGVVPLATEGTLVEKQGSCHWVSRIGNQKIDTYLGRLTDDNIAQKIAQKKEEKDSREALMAKTKILTRSGLQMVDSSTASVLAVLANMGFFSHGGVLVGTNAFLITMNALGVAPSVSNRTEDVDVAQNVDFCFSGKEKIDLERLRRKLEETGISWTFVPSLPSHLPSTSLIVKKGALRLDLLVDGENTGKPVLIKSGYFAEPLPHLNYLIEDAQKSVALSPIGAIPVVTPNPARLACHKLFSAGERPIFFASKREKDLKQATDLLEALLINGMADVIVDAWQSLPGKATQKIEKKLTEEARGLLDEAGVFSDYIGSSPSLS